jgi:MerR family transcriptional regulator, light-induced transcriptional regulator
VEASGLLRIGELSRRAGVSPELLRAWERRYGLLEPARSAGGLRLYSLDDVERVRRMREHLAGGLAAAEAAALARAGGPDGTPEPAAAGDPAALGRELAAAITAFDEPRAQGVLDALLATTSLDHALSVVLLPYLRELGERWHRGDASVAEEHFATAILRSRLTALARGWGRGLGPPIVLACAPGEQHDIALIAFGLALRERGWRIVYLGADSPVESIVDAARSADAPFVVVSAVAPRRFREVAERLELLPRRHRLCLAGPGAATTAVPADGDALRLVAAPVEEAERLTALIAGGAGPS